MKLLFKLIIQTRSSEKMLTKKFFKSKQEAEVTFEFNVSQTDKVQLVAEFNNWQPLDMKYVKKDKVYRTKVRLPKDRKFHFRYLINDNVWENDHQADAYIANAFGSDNSVVDTAVI
jgi:1,4-alpha-glucan branching enzyme